MLKAGHYTDLLRQVNELKRQLHLVEAERKACEDEGSETIKRNQQQLNRLKQDVGDIKLELSDQVRNSRQNHPMNSSQMGILQLLKENNIDYGKYKLTKSAQEILDDLDWRIADIVKQADLTKHQIQTMYQRINEIDEQLAAEPRPESPMAALSSAGSSSSAVKATPYAVTKMMNEEATLTEIQSIRQKMAEAYHIQRQYKTILDVISTERIGYESQLMDLEKSTAEAKLEAAKLKDVREAAKRARDGARTELQHHEETLVASTRETDRLLSDYKRRIDEMKSSANASNRQGRTSNQQQQMTPTGRVAALPGVTPGILRPSGPSNSSGLTVAGASGGDVLVDQEERQAMYDAKKAIDHLKSVTGAADVRSTIRIVDAQKDKCDELRQQFHVLQERVQYLAQLKETLFTRLTQLIEAQAMSSSSHSTRPTPRFLEEFFNDDVAAATSIEQQRAAAAREVEEIMDQQLDLNEALATLASNITKICSQIPFGPPVEEVNYPTQSASMTDHLNVLNLLESKLSSLMELVKSLDAIKAEPSTANANPNNNPDLLYSQVGTLSIPSTPRLPGAPDSARLGMKLLQPHDSPGATAPTAAVAASDRARGANPKIRNNDSGSDEDQVPTRGFLKRQTRIIVEAKTKKQNQRPRKND